MDNKVKKISFILPYKPKRPTGGFKIMYEYANRLSKKGYSIHLYYPLKTRFMKYRLPFVVRWIMSKIEGFGTYRWFDFEPKITMSYINSVSDRTIADADVVIATWWSAAAAMGQLNPSKGKKINLIQGFENWEGNEDLLYESYDMKDTTNVVVASYLKKIVENHTKNPVILIPNSIDTDIFKVTRNIEERNPYSICMLYSEQEIKGTVFGLEALYSLKEKYVQLKVDLFGVYDRPEELPDWITFYKDPDNLVEIFNNNSIFISNSLTEGMALTPMEAMHCGCAVVCTDIPGHSDYAFDEETALLIETKNPVQLADKLTYLFDNSGERIELAKRGNKYIQKYSWNNAVNMMVQVIEDTLNQ